MSRQDGPWRDDEPPSPRERGRLGLWLAFLLAVAGGAVLLARAFPEALRAPQDRMALAYSLGVVALVSTALLRLRRGALAQHLRHAAIWIVIVAVLALAYAFAGDLQGVSRRLALAFSAGDPVRTAERELVIPQDESGGYSVVARVDGHRVVFLVDTGASETVLSPDDARRLGVAVDALSYDYAAETANGVGYGAPYAAGALEVGPIRMQDFAMTINQAPMSRSLLGLSFLDRLKSFEVRDRKLILRW